MRKLNIGLLAVAIAFVLAPTAVMAATGSFSSSSSTTALAATNTGSGIAVRGTANSGYAGYFSRTASTGTTPAVYAKTSSAVSGAPAIFGRASSTGANSTIGVLGQSDATTGRGVYGLATKTSGANFGVWGKTLSTNTSAAGVYGTATATTGSPVGVWGNSNAATGAGVYGFGHYGVQGDSAAMSDGTYGLLGLTDTGLSGHLVARNGNVAGTCTIASGQTSMACTFPNAFNTGVVPVVLLTPTASIQPAVGGNSFWVDSQTVNGFTIHIATAVAPAAAVTFNYFAIGVDASLPTG